MPHLSVSLKVDGIGDTTQGDLIAYDDGTKWAIVLPPTQNGRPSVMSLSEMKLISPSNDWGDTLDGFHAVANYGREYRIFVQKACALVDHLSSAKKGDLALKGSKLFLAIDSPQCHGGGRQAVDLQEGKCHSADFIGFNLGVFGEWSIVLIGDEHVSHSSITVFNFP